MPVPVSSLSLAVQGIADFLDGQFGEDVMISTDTPQRASDRAKGGDKHYLNLFTYRVMPSAFHAANASDEPCFIRINVLLTPFLSDQDGQASDADLRILGHAIRFLHSRPIIPGVLPGNSVEPEDFRSGPHLDYRLEAVLQAPGMEELNHIWTTQGGDLAYRLSAIYEFALIPIEPLEHKADSPPVTTSIFDLQPNIKARDATGFIKYGDEPSAHPLSDIQDKKLPPPTNWLPVVLVSQGEALSNKGTVASGAANISVALAGPPGERIALEVSWVRANDSRMTQAPQVFIIASHLIDDPAAISLLDLESAADGDVATVLTRPVNDAGVPLASSPFANTLLIAVGGP
jgi:hypothetical protein